jgi:TonB family protein
MAISSASERALAAGPSRSERRRHPRARFSVRRPVSISLDRKATAVVLDLSQTGVGIRSLGPVKRGSRCRLNFQLPDTRERIEAEGIATWSDDSCRAGFEFSAMSAPTRALLAEWVERRSYSGPSPFARPANASSSKGTEIIALERQLERLEREDALRLIVARCQSLTEADGTAIAFSGPDGMLCRASVGNAPDLGTSISPDSGLSGECLRTGVVVRCENIELDPRIDREVCRALNLRSAVVVPVIVDSYSVAGLLEAFSARPHAFSGRHVLLLRQLAELISQVASRPVEQARVEDAKAEAAKPEGKSDKPAVTPAVPAPAHASEAAAATDPASRVICDVCGFENLPIDRDCQNCDVPLPTALDSADTFAVETTAAPVERETIRPLRTPEASSRGLPRLLGWFVLGVVLAVSGVAGVRWWRTQQTLAAPPSVELSRLLNTSGEATGPQAPAAEASVATENAVLEPAPKPKPSPKQTRDAEAVLAATRLPQALPPVSAPKAPEAAALITASKLDSPLVAVISAPVATPRWVIASSSPVPAKLLHKVDPVYPPAAVAHRIEGKVLLRATVTYKGTVQGVSILQGNQLLAQAAVHAVKQWRYSPAQLDGQAVDADANITISFSLNQ